MSPSGVASQGLALIEGLIKTGKYTFKTLGGAIKHSDYSVMQPHPDLVVKPVDGFGTPDQIKKIILTERPDAVLMITDPRQFYFVWSMQEEIQRICPITYWTIWDNDPFPDFNDVWYKSTDLLNCISWKTYELLKPNYPDKVNYIPHAYGKHQFFPMPENDIKQIQQQHFGERSDWFKVLWINRNATRKLPADVMACFKEFLDELEAKYGHRKALMLIHSNPLDIEGTNMYAVSEQFGLQNNIMFSTEQIPQQYINVLHNITDTCINISKAEGFGLSILQTLQVGKPAIALTTGGMTRQIIDWRDGTENGVAIKPAARQLVGSQMVPYIYEDFCSHKDVVDALMKVHDMTDDDKSKMKKKVLDYVDFEFSYDKMIFEWDRTLEETIEKHKKTKNKRWSFEEIKANKFKTSTTPSTINSSNANAVVKSTQINNGYPIDCTKEILKTIKTSEVA